VHLNDVALVEVLVGRPLDRPETVSVLPLRPVISRMQRTAPDRTAVMISRKVEPNWAPSVTTSDADPAVRFDATESETLFRGVWKVSGIGASPREVKASRRRRRPPQSRAGPSIHAYAFDNCAVAIGGITREL
jgi:hypothetical protein